MTCLTQPCPGPEEIETREYYRGLAAHEIDKPRRRRRAAQHFRMVRRVRQLDEHKSEQSIAVDPTGSSLPFSSSSSASHSVSPSVSLSRSASQTVSPSPSLSSFSFSSLSPPPTPPPSMSEPFPSTGIPLPSDSNSDPSPSNPSVPLPSDPLPSEPLPSEPPSPSPPPPSQPPPESPPPNSQSSRASQSRPPHSAPSDPSPSDPFPSSNSSPSAPLPSSDPTPPLPPSQPPLSDPPPSETAPPPSEQPDPSQPAPTLFPSDNPPDGPSSAPPDPPSSIRPSDPDPPPPFTQQPSEDPGSWTWTPMPGPSNYSGSSSASTMSTGALGTETSRVNAFSASTGSIIGVALGALGFILLVGLGAFFVIRRYRRRRRQGRRFSDIGVPAATPVPHRQRSMTLFEDDDDAHSGSASRTTETVMRGIPGIVAALDLGDNPRPGPSIRGYSSPFSSDENNMEQGHPITTASHRTRRGSSVEPPDSASIYSDPPPTPAFPPTSYNYQPSNNGHSSGEHGSSSVGHSSHGHGTTISNGRTRAHTPPPTIALGGSFRPKSPSPSLSVRSPSAERENKPASLLSRLRGKRKSRGMRSTESLSISPVLATPVPNIIVRPTSSSSSSATPTGTMRGRLPASDRAVVVGRDEMGPVQYPFPCEEGPVPQQPPLRHPWTVYVRPPDDGTDSLSVDSAPIGLLRQVSHSAGSRTSLGDHVDYTRPMLGVVFNRLESTTTVTGSVVTARSGMSGRGDDGHSL